VVDFLPNSKKEDICFFLQTIRNANPVGRIILILDNFRSHRANATMVQAFRLDIDLVFLPPYSPDLNPIEYIWKSVKRVISDKFVKCLEDMRMIISRLFLDCSSRLHLPDLGSLNSLETLVFIVRFGTIVSFC